MRSILMCPYFLLLLLLLCLHHSVSVGMLKWQNRVHTLYHRSATKAQSTFSGSCVQAQVWEQHSSPIERAQQLRQRINIHTGFLKLHFKQSEEQKESIYFITFAEPLLLKQQMKRKHELYICICSARLLMDLSQLKEMLRGKHDTREF